MSIKQFELFHGAVLAKLVRRGQRVALTMIETRPGDPWAVYTINDAVDLFVKYRTASTARRRLIRPAGALSWSFVFTPDQLRQIRELQGRRDVFAVLVCGRAGVRDPDQQTCLLRPDQLERLLDLDDPTQQSVGVRYIPRKKLRVSSSRTERLLISQSALDRWDVPGS